jgi:hypothetical protein
MTPMLFAFLIAQSPQSANAPSAQVSFDRAVPLKTLKPLPANKLKEMLPGHILDESPYPADAGPLVFYENGTVTKFGGWGNPGGKYAVQGNKAVITYVNGFTYSISFYSDSGNRYFYRYDREDTSQTAYPLRLKRLPR